MDLGLLIQLVSGIVGASVMGAVLKPLSIGPLGNIITGIVGGALGGQILDSTLAGGALAQGLDAGAIATRIAGGGLGGAGLMLLTGLLRTAFVR